MTPELRESKSIKMSTWKRFTQLSPLAYCSGAACNTSDKLCLCLILFTLILVLNEQPVTMDWSVVSGQTHRLIDMS